MASINEMNNSLQTPVILQITFPVITYFIWYEVVTTSGSIIWVSNLLNTKNWENINIPNTNDITAIQLRGDFGKLTIFNIYNDCTHSNTETTLRTFLQTQARRIISSNNVSMTWAGDFNRHHLLWDRDEDTCLFTRQSQRAAEKLIELLAKYDMVMALPKGVPTLHHMSSKRYSHPDNIFCMPNLQESMTRCEVDASSCPTCTDHFPIVMHLTTPQPRAPISPNYNFRAVDWEIFRKMLKTHLDEIPPQLQSQQQNNLTKQVKTSPAPFKTRSQAA